MSFTEEDLKRAAETKLWIEERLNELEEEETRLRELLLVVDGVLKASSFVKASEIAAPAQTTPEPTIQPEEVRPLRARDGRVLAQATITSKTVSIALAPDINLRASTPPFKTFYLNRILAGMRRRDEEMMRAGNLKPDELLNFVVEEEGARLKKIVVNNYRDKDRLSEVLKSVIWVFSRMLEKSEG